jgi:hydrogenase maturation protease
MILLIGYGNPLRRDDGAGPALADWAAAAFPPSQLRVLVGHQLVPEMAEAVGLPDVDGVIFLDAAARDGDTHGLEREGVRVRELSGSPGAFSLGHGLSAGTILAAAEGLCGRAIAGWMVTVRGADFAHGTGFSPAAAEALDAAKPELASLIARLSR